MRLTLGGGATVFVSPSSFELIDAVARLVATDMASILASAVSDLSDDAAVIYTLARAGFGLASIRALHRCAAEMAATMRGAISQRH